MRRIVAIFFLVALLFVTAHAQDFLTALSSYTTSFNLTENPICEASGGSCRWLHQGTSWKKVKTMGGNAFGTQTGLGDFDDSYAYLAADFTNDQSGEGVVYRNPSGVFTCSKEVEIFLRMSDTATTARGYEVLFSMNASNIQIVRWNGGYGNFKVCMHNSTCDATSGTTAVPLGRAFVTGDVVKGEVIGDTINAYVNGVLFFTTTDAGANKWADGHPGIAMFRRNCGSETDVGFQSYTATSLGSEGRTCP